MQHELRLFFASYECAKYPFPSVSCRSTVRFLRHGSPRVAFARKTVQKRNAPSKRNKGTKKKTEVVRVFLRSSAAYARPISSGPQRGSCLSRFALRCVVNSTLNFSSVKVPACPRRQYGQRLAIYKRKKAIESRGTGSPANFTSSARQLACSRPGE